MDDHFKQLNNSTGDALFDASQYSFFGNEAVVEEVELGGFEDDDSQIVVSDAQEYPINREESEIDKSNSDAEALASTFSKLNTVVSGTRGSGASSHGGSRGSSSAADWAQDEFPNWVDQQIFGTDNTQEETQFSSHPPVLDPHLSGPIYLPRISSYPEQQQLLQSQQQFDQRHPPSDPLLIPKSSYIKYPSPEAGSWQDSPNNNTHYMNMTHIAGRPQLSSSSPDLPAFLNSRGDLTVLNHGLPLGRNSSQFSGRSLNQFVHQNGYHPIENINGENRLLHRQVAHRNGLMPPLQQQNRLQRPVQPSYEHLSSMHPQLFNPHVSPVPPIVSKFGKMHNIGGVRDQRPISFPQNRDQTSFPRQGFNYSSQKCNNGSPQSRWKCMTSNEIENIHRTHLAATQTNDPYVDDYYNQARLTKKFNGTRQKSQRDFCPIHLSDNSCRARPNSEPHPFLQVEALGRIPFSSIRRPRPLLDVSNSKSTSHNDEEKDCDKPLEQEPMLAARVIIEDGFSLLLDVDDIDRFLQFNQLQDNGVQLRQKRQAMIEKLASSLQLVDPQVGSSHKGDIVFLRVMSLPKGRKLLSLYLKHLSPNTEPLLIACMTIFRHLTFLIGVQVADDSTANLVMTVASCVSEMDLGALSACIATVVFSNEAPPLGSSAGDGASTILKSILLRATSLLTNPHGASSSDRNTRALWQGSFDQFFNLLTKYCVDKFDSMAKSPIKNGVGSDAFRNISKEIPVELLRASLPHTNEYQRKLLLDFAQRSMPVT